MKPEDYIGKKLSECPDGTKAVVINGSGWELVRDFIDGKALNAGDGFGDGSAYTVTHILTLGKPRPKTLDDEEPGVVWKDMYGDLHWRGDGAEVLISWQGGAPVHAADPASDYSIYPEWTRLGPITGIEIDGKVYRGEGGGE